MKVAAVLVLGPAGLIELLVRLVVVVVLTVTLMAFMLDYEADDIHDLLTPSSWSLLRELAGVAA